MPKPSIKQLLVFGVLIIIVFIGSGFATKKLNKPDVTKEEIDRLNVKRLFKADNHLQTITQPNEIKKQLAVESNG